VSNPRGNPQNFRRDGSPGHRGAGGRPPDWLKKKCCSLVEKKKLIEFLAAVAAGDPFIEKTRISGSGDIENVRGSADVKDRLRAVEMLLDRGWGKSVQVMDTPEGVDLARMLLIRSVESVPSGGLHVERPGGRNGNGALA